MKVPCDFLDEIPRGKPYLEMLGERPTFRQVDDDRKAAQVAMVAKK